MAGGTGLLSDKDAAGRLRPPFVERDPFLRVSVKRNF